MVQFENRHHRNIFSALGRLRGKFEKSLISLGDKTLINMWVRTRKLWERKLGERAQKLGKRNSYCRMKNLKDGQLSQDVLQFKRRVGGQSPVRLNIVIQCRRRVLDTFRQFCRGADARERVPPGRDLRFETVSQLNPMRDEIGGNNSRCHVRPSDGRSLL